jgi:cellulose synthase/poly-beta-1,6-N-acetylglucosamine synthase-like glycosyltransferase
MGSLFSYTLATLACLFGIPATVLFLEVVAAIALPPRKCLQRPNQDSRRRVAIIIPAHNESAGLLPTIGDINLQMRAGDRMLVVADNCIDDTAAVAAATGAEVIERNDPTRMGKGYALDFALKHLSLDPPAIVIIIDADCRVEEGAIDQLATACAMTHSPIQALNLMTAPDETRINYRVAEFAWRVKNWVRPLGLNALNLPCQLMGTGMAFPWGVIRSGNLANRSIVEDLKLGIDLAQSGTPAQFCPSASVKSHFPLSVEGAESQRQRWEGGHIGMILTTAPRLIFKAIAGRNFDLLALTLDLAVPPLSLLVILLAGMSLVGGIAVLFGYSSVALIISGACFIAVLLAIFLSWLKCGRDLLPPSAAFSIILYIVAKLPIYRQLLSRNSDLQWTRTDRNKDD